MKNMYEMPILAFAHTKYNLDKTHVLKQEYMKSFKCPKDMHICWNFVNQIIFYIRAIYTKPR